MCKGPETREAQNVPGRSGALGKPAGPMCISDDLEPPHGLEGGAGHPTFPSPRICRLTFLPWTQLNIFIEAPGMEAWVVVPCSGRWTGSFRTASLPADPSGSMFTHPLWAAEEGIALELPKRREEGVQQLE